MKDRPFFDTPVDQLEELLQKHKAQPVILRQVRDELQYRGTKRAKQLIREVDGVLDGRVPVKPKPPRAARPEDQLHLLDPNKSK
jgi:hypothetical protein